MVARERSLFRMRASLLKRFLAKIGQEGLWLQQLEGKVGRGAGERVEVLAESINTFMITTYQRLSQHLKDAGQGSSHITDRDLTVLGRRMVVHYAAMEGKLMKRDLVSQRQVTFKQLSYAWRSRRKQTGTWELYGGTPPAAIPYGARGALFAMEPYVESVVVQAVLNGYYHPGVLVKMFPNPTQVSLRDIIRLMEVLLERFPQGEEFTISSEDLLEGEKVRRAILIVGLDSPMLTGAFTTFTLFFMTSWGAYHIRYFHNEEGFSTAIDALYEARKDVAFAFESGDVHVFVPERIRKRLRGGEAAVHI